MSTPPTPPGPPDPLDPLFAEWQASAPDPADNLETLVWRRIAAAETPAAARGGVLAAIEAMFSRPSFTAAFVTCCVLLGLFLAETRASRLESKRSGEFVLGYLRQIDPQFDGIAPAAELDLPRP
ncbi:MAG TPA: hypothetical protein VG734_14385 [Lacunisphaera sp.]|nr:hypothetical protein [Lacunisphaera sp.]